jgi:hypothetical protein
VRIDTFVCIASLAIGCGTNLEFIRLNPPPKQLVRRSGDEVQMFVSGRPNRPFVEIGVIESQQQVYSQDNAADLFALMREEAGHQGCEALIVNGANDAIIVGGGGTQPVSSATLKGYKATCIVYLP